MSKLSLKRLDTIRPEVQDEIASFVVLVAVEGRRVYEILSIDERELLGSSLTDIGTTIGTKALKAEVMGDDLSTILPDILKRSQESQLLSRILRSIVEVFHA